MNELPRNAKELPPGLSLEKPAKNLASLATTEALLQLKETVLAQWQFTEPFAELAKYGIRPVDRMLFYGPPGNGKTMAASWIAKQLDVPLYRVRCEALVEPYIGRTASNISAVMRWLERHGDRCVVLLDEVEQILISRNTSGDGIANREVGSAMTVFWQFLDRWEAPTLFILATNLPDRLDAALLSRIDLQMEFGPPTAEQAADAIRYWQEVLHAYGSDLWGPKLLDVPEWESFRALFYAIQQHVRSHVTSNGKAQP